MPRKKKQSDDEKKKAAKERMRTLRVDEQHRTQEQSKNTDEHRRARENPNFRNVERDRDADAHRSARSNSEFRAMERERDASAHKSARQDTQLRTPEKQRDAIAHQNARKDPNFRTPEKERDASSHRTARLNDEFRTREQQQNTLAHRVARQDPRRRKLEFSKIAETKQKRIKSLSFDDLKSLFNNDIREHPEHICPCCGRLLYKFQTATIMLPDLMEKGYGEDFVQAILNTCTPAQVQKLRFCVTCKNNITVGKVPRLALSNGLDFPVIPPELAGLSPLEERLVALRIPFMQIRPMGFEQQSTLKGNVINVENDLNVTTKVIPRRYTESSTVQVQLMRRLIYRKPYMYETIRPHKVHMAASYLVKTELYTEEKVKLSSHLNGFSTNVTSEFRDTEHDENCDSTVDNLQTQELAENETEEILTGADETLIHNHMDYSLITGVRIAPGEGKCPISQFSDSHAQEKSFPLTYGGRKRIVKEFKKGQRKLTYTDIAKSEIMRFDRRACKPTNVLYAFKKSYNEKVSQCVSTFIRKRRGNQGKFKAFQVKDAQFLKSIVENDEGYSVFKNLRSSPSYWAAKCKKVIAMVRQLGKCSLFITLSAAESKWNELLVLLMKLTKNTDISEEEAEKLSTEQKSELIRSDPVTCMRHFDRKYQILHKYLLKTENGIFSPHELLDYFHRLEFQMRGSPHSHGLYWLKDAPEYLEGDEESETACIAFIDKYITCARHYNEESSQYVKYQVHRHSHTCRKGMRDRFQCRFNFPRPPLPATKILKPLPNHTSAKKRIHWNMLYCQIQLDLNQRGRNPESNPSFEEYLSSLGMCESDYITAIRSSIKRTTVFNKREVNEAFINPYNSSLLCAWKANIDIQFVLDTYACAKYCVGYILKSDGGVSKLFKEINRTAANGNTQICSKLERYAKALWNGTEISAQEAAGFLLGIPNVNSSRSDIYIDTSPPNERTHILKSVQELEKLKDDDENIYQFGLLDHYVNRPETFANICLAEFAANFDFSKTKRRVISVEEDVVEVNGLSASVSEGDDSETVYYSLLDGSGFIKKRGTSKIIRFRHYSQKQDPSNYWREQLMLFVPWRDEEADLIDIDPIRKSISKSQTIEENSAIFYHSKDFNDITIRSLVDEIEGEDVQENEEDDDDAMGHREDEEQLANIMLSQEPSKCHKKRIEQFLPPRLIDHSEYFRLMQSLNLKQRKFVLSTLHCLKTQTEPFHYFLSGGAGVGKSHAITAIVQSVLRFFGSIAGRDQSSLPVIVTAFTGKAAFNVFGMTLHSAFHLPPTQSNTISDLNDDLRNTLAAKFRGLKLIIIDEISMCSLKLLKFMDTRMRQITGCNQDFGGKSVLVVGHLRQLSPICGQFSFEPEKGKEAVVNPLWRNFKIFELDEIMRQKGEMEMCKALNNMSEGVMDATDIKLMSSRKISEENKPPTCAIWLFQTNNECARHNQVIHDALKTEGYLSIASDLVDGKASKEKKRLLLLDAMNLSQKNCDGLRYETYLKVQAHFFISTNIDVQDGLFNGATGRLMHLEKRNANMPGSSSDSDVIRAWMRFENPLIGAEMRTSFSKSHHGILPPGVQPSWTPIEKMKRPLSRLYNDNLKVVRSQFPLVACDGMTIAKSQGSSMESVVVSTRGSKLTRSELYVACSRATSLAGLYIDGDFTAPPPPNIPDIVGNEMERLRENPMQFPLRFLQDYGDEVVKIYFHNVQSLGQHYLDLTADHCAMSADLIILVEPHLLAGDKYDFPNFDVLHRVNCAALRNSEGVLLLGKSSTEAEIQDCIMKFSSATHCIFLKIVIGQVTVVAVYRHPKYKKSDFMNLLEDVLSNTTGHAIVIGDINVDLIHGQNELIYNCFARFGFISRLNTSMPSTDGGTQIDCCFSNFQPQVSIYETYYSYHKAICVTFAK